MSRFVSRQDPSSSALNASIAFDRRLGPTTSRSRARTRHARGAGGIIAEADRDALLAALDEVERELEDGDFPFEAGDEDIHMAIERRVTEIAGPVGGQAAHGALAQRPGGDGPGDVRARPHGRGRRARSTA